MDENRKIIYPAIYRHFKQKFCATMGISSPAPSSFIESIRHNEKCTVMYATDTEDKYSFEVFHLNGSYYHNRLRNRQVVLYKRLYDDTGIHARDLDMFTSLVDKSKYPDVKQIYRFNLVRITEE